MSGERLIRELFNGLFLASNGGAMDHDKDQWCPF